MIGFLRSVVVYVAVIFIPAIILAGLVYLRYVYSSAVQKESESKSMEQIFDQQLNYLYETTYKVTENLQKKIKKGEFKITKANCEGILQNKKGDRILKSDINKIQEELPMEYIKYEMEDYPQITLKYNVCAYNLLDSKPIKVFATSKWLLDNYTTKVEVPEPKDAVPGYVASSNNGKISEKKALIPIDSLF